MGGGGGKEQVEDSSQSDIYIYFATSMFLLWCTTSPQFCGVISSNIEFDSLGRRRDAHELFSHQSLPRIADPRIGRIFCEKRAE